jgi:cyclopropane-fatty-acyl-phospholipid synthase
MKQGRAEDIVRELLSGAGITVGGPEPWDIQVHDPRFYERLLRQASMGLGESYMDGWWDVPALEEFIDKDRAGEL